MTIILIITTIWFFGLYVKYKLGLTTLLYYIAAKEYPLPTDSEIRKCTEKVVKKTLGMKN